MDTADAPGCKDSDAIGMRGKHRGGDRGRTGPTSCNGGRQIAEVHFRNARTRRKLVQLGTGEPDTNGSPQNPDRGRNGTPLPDLALDRERGGHPVGVWKSVGDHRGLERDDGPPSGDGIGDFVGTDVRTGHAVAPAADHWRIRAWASVRVATSNDATPRPSIAKLALTTARS